MFYLAGGMAKLVECLPNKSKALSTTKQQENLLEILHVVPVQAPTLSKKYFLEIFMSEV
jgi:hypothetical protein